MLGKFYYSSWFMVAWKMLTWSLKLIFLLSFFQGTKHVINVPFSLWKISHYSWHKIWALKILQSWPSWKELEVRGSHPMPPIRKQSCTRESLWSLHLHRVGEYFLFGSFFIKKNNQTEILFFEKKPKPNRNQVKPTGFGSVRVL